jgi:hypothetical protein
MSELANYSIETDYTVLLSFKDGRKVRVPVGQLAAHLNPLDLEKIKSAIRLRRDFIHQHTPKIIVVGLATGLLLALLAAGDRAVASLWHHNEPMPRSQPSHTGIVRSVDLPTPTVKPTPPGSVKGEAVAAAPPIHRTVIRSVKHHPSLLSTKPIAAPTNPVAIIEPLASLAPAPSPEPTITPVPTDTLPSPTPTTPPQGQVLGDSTGPNDPDSHTN